MTPDRRFAAVLAIFFIEAVAFSSWLPRLPEIRSTLGLSEAELGLVLLAMPAAAIVVMPFAGLLSTRLDAKALNALCMVWLLVATMLIPLAGSAVGLAAALFAVGLGTGSMGVAMNVAGLAVEQALGRPILARCHATFSIGVAFGGLLGGELAARAVAIGWHLPMVAVALAAVLVAAIPALPRDTGNGTAQADPETPRFALPSRTLAMPAAVAFCCLLAEGAVLDWSAIFLTDVLLATDNVGLGMAAFAGAMATMRLLGDWLVTRVGPSATIGGGGAVAATGFALVVAAPTQSVALLGFALAGLGLAGIVPVTFRTAGALMPDKPGVAVAAVSTVGYTGFLAGPAVMGLIAEFGGLRVSFAMVAVLAGVIVLASQSFRRLAPAET